MANAAKLALREPVRMMIVGYPGSAKTGGLAALANMGYKLRILDYDGNIAPLIRYTKPEFLKNIDVMLFEDKLKAGPAYIDATNPDAFYRGLQAMDSWKYKEADGTEVDLGASKDWGCDTIVVLDSLTAMGEASKRRAMRLGNKTPTNMTDGTWGFAMKEQDAFIEKLTSAANNFHVIVLAHLKMIGPNDIRKGDSDVTVEIKQRLVDMVPTRLFPSALGKALPPVIGGHFPAIICAETRYKNGQPQRVLSHIPREDLDLKLPIPNFPTAPLPVETGLATIFKELAPPLDECFGTSGKA